jgi:hypothetical protein
LTVFDFTAITARSDRSAVEALRKRATAAGVEPTEISDTFGLGMVITGFVLCSVIFALVVNGHRAVSIFVAIGMLGWGGLGAFFLFGIGYFTYRVLVRWGQYFRALQFAERNGMTFTVSGPKPEWDGAIFRISDTKPRATSVFRAATAPVFEVGNFHFGVFRNDKPATQRWGYVAVDVGHQLPHATLRSTSGRLSRRRWDPDGAYTDDPILSLGAVADRMFTLYCPVGGESQAQLIFTADLLSRLARLGRNVDAELKGSVLFVYSCKPFRIPRPRALQRVFGIISAVQ